jgi:hypothetical protein
MQSSFLSSLNGSPGHLNGGFKDAFSIVGDRYMSAIMWVIQTGFDGLHVSHYTYNIESKN